MTTGGGSIAVLGAGVVGLAAADELGRRGHRVTTFDPEPPGTGQSFGRVRAFRIAHPSAFAVELAVRSLNLWREWERRRDQPLIRSHGLLISDPDRAAWAAAMATHDQPFGLPSRDAAGACCPLIDPQRLDPETLLIDPQAGAIDTRSTIDWLLASTGDHDWRLVREHVSEVRTQGDGSAAVVTPSGEHRFDAVVVAAGAGTEALARPLGLQLDTQPAQRTWATMRPRFDVSTTAMWMTILAGHRYAWAQLGADGAVALSGDWSSNDPEDTSAGSFSAAVDYARTHLPALDPSTARKQETLVAPVDVPDGKPFAISTRGAITLVEGNQLFKFAPLLGVLIADAVGGTPPAGVPNFAPTN